MPSKPRWVDPAIAAEMANVCRETVYRYIRKGELPARRLGSNGRYRILVSDVKAFAQGVPVVEPHRAAL